MGVSLIFTHISRPYKNRSHIEFERNQCDFSLAFLTQAVGLGKRTEQPCFCSRRSLEQCEKRIRNDTSQTTSCARSSVGHWERVSSIRPQDGCTKEASEAQEELNSHLDTLDQIASEAHLKPSSFARLSKAKRVLPSMSETLVFFWTLIASGPIQRHSRTGQSTRWPAIGVKREGRIVP